MKCGGMEAEGVVKMLKGSRKEGKEEEEEDGVGELLLSEVVLFADAGIKIKSSSVKKGGAGEGGREGKEDDMAVEVKDSMMVVGS